MVFATARVSAMESAIAPVLRISGRPPLHHAGKLELP
jgi:hypothetical protein